VFFYVFFSLIQLHVLHAIALEVLKLLKPVMSSVVLASHLYQLVQDVCAIHYV